MEYSIGTPEVTNLGIIDGLNKCKVVFPITGNPYKVIVTASSTDALDNGQPTKMSANGEFPKDAEVVFYFTKLKGTFNYEATAYTNTSQVLATKSGSYSVDCE
jgi:hypothetical protein